MGSPIDIHELLHRKEDLHADLKPYLEQDSSLGTILRHPLIFQVPYHAMMNAMINAQYTAKSERVKEVLAQKDYSGYVFWHERAYRISKFVEIMEELSDKEYWSILGAIWTDSENIWQFSDLIEELLASERPGREAMMDGYESETLDRLPDEFMVYRGHQDINQHGYSWTLSFWMAHWMAGRYRPKKQGVLSAKISKEHVVALLLGRSEAEIVCLPEDLKDIQPVKPIKRLPWLAPILEQAKADYVLKGKSHHNHWHWDKVERNALKLAAETEGADALIVQLFAILHDCKRLNEFDDPEHGKRAAQYAVKLHKKGTLKINKRQLDILASVCEHHNDGQISADPTIGVCWDADRLDLIRVGILPKAELLSTAAAKTLLWKI